MTLTPFTGTTSITTIRSNFDDTTTTLAANALLGQKDFEIGTGLFATLAAGAVLRDSSVAFTLQDDAQIRCVMAAGSASGAGAVLTVSLVVDIGVDLVLEPAPTIANGGLVWLLGKTVSATTTAGGATAITARTTYTSTSGTMLRALEGVGYRLVVTAASGTFTNVNAVVQLRSRRRRA